MKKFIGVILAVILAMQPLSCSAAFAGEINLSLGDFSITADGEVREIGDNTYQISDYGLDYSYLIVGSESCLLIDCGVGFEDYRAKIEPYTDGKPVVLALTHGHVDHAGASQQFETVYLNEKDNEVLQKQRSLFFRKAFAGMIVTLERLFLIDVPQISNKNNVDSTLCNMEDGHSFKLGDRTVTFTLTPGHTPGSGCFFDSKTHYLFTGDMVSGAVLLFAGESESVSVYRKSLDIISELQKNAEKIYIGHSAAPIDPETTDVLIASADELLNSSALSLPLPYIKIKTANKAVVIIGMYNKIK